MCSHATLRKRGCAAAVVTIQSFEHFMLSTSPIIDARLSLQFTKFNLALLQLLIKKIQFCKNWSFFPKKIVFTNNPLRIKCSIQNMPKTVFLLLLILTPWTHGAYRHETPVLSKPIEVIHLSEDLVVLDKPCSLPVSDTHTLLTQFLYFSFTVLPYHENFWTFHWSWCIASNKCDNWHF